MKSSILDGKARLVPLRGGLGNQLFQAAGILFLRNEGFEASGIFPSSLARGKHPEAYKSLLQSLGVPIYENSSLGLGIGIAIRGKEELDHLIGKFFRREPGDQAFGTRETILEIAKSNLVVKHYFQEPEIATISRLAEALGEKLGKNNVDKLFLHIRGGDYLNATSLFGEVGHEYFLEALETARWTGQVTVMTDDEDYATVVAQRLDRKFKVSGLSVLTEFELAVNAEYFIGTNSTLSWWIARTRSALGRPSSLPQNFTPSSSPLYSTTLPSNLSWVSLHDSRFSSEKKQSHPNPEAP